MSRLEGGIEESWPAFTREWKKNRIRDVQMESWASQLARHAKTKDRFAALITRYQR